MGFATAPLVAEGCVMMRKCHLNTCPVGSQRRILNSEKVCRHSRSRCKLLLFVAEEVRQIMAQLGARR